MTEGPVVSAITQITHVPGIVEVALDGEFGFQTSRKALGDIVSTAVRLFDCEILLDARKADVRMSVADLWFLAAEFSKHRDAFMRKTAVLCPAEGYEHAAFWELCSQNQGLRIRAFTTIQDAKTWLWEGAGGQPVDADQQGFAPLSDAAEQRSEA